MSKLTALLTMLMGSIYVGLELKNPAPMGLIVIFVIASPVIILILAALLGRPRRRKVSALFIGWLLVMFIAWMVAVYAVGFVTGLFY